MSTPGADRAELDRLRGWLRGRPPAAFAVSGSRGWQQPLPVWAVLEVVPAGWRMFHGAARGLDLIAAMWWAERHGTEAARAFKANWAELGRAAGPLRNRFMIDHGPEFLLAWRCPGSSPGTDGCVAYAEERGVEVFRFGAFPRSA
jgi:hypothetical protein